MPNATAAAPSAGFPSSAPLPGLTAALSRRAALFGAVAATVVPTVTLAAPAAAAGLSIGDARLVELAETLDALNKACEACPAGTVEDTSQLDALTDNFTPLVEEMWCTPAESIAGLIAKAKGTTIPCIRDCEDGGNIAQSLADDLLDLLGVAHG